MPSHDDVLAFIKRQDTPIHSTDVAAEFGIDNLEAIDLLLELHNLERIEQHHRNDGRGAILWVTR